MQPDLVAIINVLAHDPPGVIEAKRRLGPDALLF